MRHALLTAALLLAAAAPARAAAPAQCPGDPIRVDRAITGSFDSSLQGSFVRVPFDVPQGTTAVRVKYCYDQPETPTPNVRHTLDLGIDDPSGFRGWGGSIHPDVTLSAEGFSTQAQYLADPKGNVPGRTTRGFRPGPIHPGRWVAELGLAAIAPRELGDADGAVGWRVEIELASDSHTAGRTPGGPTDSPVGIGATAVYAKQLSERGIKCAVKAGHTYAKIAGAKGPDLRFTGKVPGARRTAIFGDTARGKKLKLAARATRAGVLQLVRNGSVIAAGSRKLTRTVTKPGRYGLRLTRGQFTEAVGTPIWFRRARRAAVTARACG